MAKWQFHPRSKQGWVSQPAAIEPSRIKPACRHSIKKEVILSSEWDSASLLPKDRVVVQSRVRMPEI